MCCSRSRRRWSLRAVDSPRCPRTPSGQTLSIGSAQSALPSLKREYAAETRFSGPSAETGLFIAAPPEPSVGVTAPAQRVAPLRAFAAANLFAGEGFVAL